jgi:hypothetical protein
MRPNVCTKLECDRLMPSERDRPNGPAPAGAADVGTDLLASLRAEARKPPAPERLSPQLEELTERQLRAACDLDHADRGARPRWVRTRTVEDVRPERAPRTRDADPCGNDHDEAATEYFEVHAEPP